MSTPDEILASFGDRAKKILEGYRRHADDPGICNSYYCGQSCSYLDEMDERDGALLVELARYADAVGT